MTTSHQSPALVWPRDDLRLGDNPAIQAALVSERPIFLLYVRDEESAGLRPLGGAARWWLGRSLAEQNFNRKFDALEWRHDPSFETAWQRGLTGYPLVDAGMRQLRQTGWMHNRVRMVVASFLIKHGQIDWRRGEAWFWDTLVDADPASNAASWQWVAGSGADAAPYFRVFNPVLQGEKFDPNGDYVRRFVPELARLPTAFIHKPWLAEGATLHKAGVTLGTTYPHPIVDHAAARQRALDSFARIRGD
ncbi:MAG TPA: FAD-binding domain-containing protein [Ancylobacter sp.]